MARGRGRLCAESGERPRVLPGSLVSIAAVLLTALMLLLLGSSSAWAAPYVQGEDLPECVGSDGGLLVSDDGATAVTGGVLGSGVAQTCIYVDSGGTWRKQAELPVETAPQALSANGDTLLASLADQEVVFVRSGESWTQQATLGQAGAQGWSVESGSISADGNTAIVYFGPDEEFDTETEQSNVRVFTRSGQTWSESATLSPVKTLQKGCSGNQVVLSANGEMVLVSDPCFNSTRGAVFAFTRSGEAWTRRQAILMGGEQQSDFGDRIALSDNGETAIIGNARGSVWTYVRKRERWVQRGIQLREGAEDCLCFGPFALTGDGNTQLVIKRIFATTINVFARSKARWTESEALAPPEAAGIEGFLEPPVVSESGETALAEQVFDYYSKPIFKTTVWTR